jgi:hypothetical protein
MWIQLLLHYDKRATQSVHSLQKKFFDLKPIAGKGIRSFLSDINNVNDMLCELDVTKAFEDDALISKILSSLPSDFFPFSSAWDSTPEVDKTLLNLSERLVKEEEKLKQIAQNPVDVTQAFYGRLVLPKPHHPSGSTHLCTGHRRTHSSHLSISKPPPPRLQPLPSVNPNDTPLTADQRQTW